MGVLHAVDLTARERINHIEHAVTVAHAVLTEAGQLISFLRQRIDGLEGRIKSLEDEQTVLLRSMRTLEDDFIGVKRAVRGAT